MGKIADEMSKRLTSLSKDPAIIHLGAEYLFGPPPFDPELRQAHDKAVNEYVAVRLAEETTHTDTSIDDLTNRVLQHIRSPAILSLGATYAAGMPTGDLVIDRARFVACLKRIQASLE